MPEIPKLTEAIVHNLARIYASKKQSDVVEILAKSTAEIEETSFDNWNGGTFGYTLRLNVPPYLYPKIESRIPALEKELYERASPLLRGYQNESLDAVLITLELKPDESWRQNAVAWVDSLSKNTSKRINDQTEFDFFISHASEDKEGFVRGLAKELVTQNARVWYDEFALTIGDSLRQSIDRGLAVSRFGIVVLSPAFFAKNWPQYELDGLVAKQIIGQKVILPLWHNIELEEIARHSPTLANTLAFTSNTMSTSNMVSELMQLVSRSR